jgi:hypothetical protein
MTEIANHKGAALDSRVDAAFGSELRLQCLAALHAWNRVNEGADSGRVETDEELQDRTIRVFEGLQSFLAAVGVVSEIFFPSNRGDAARAEYLRATYEVSVGSPLANKQVRHAFLHSGERLDTFLRDRPNRRTPIGPFSIGPLPGRAPSPGASSFLRIFDTSNWRIVVEGRELDLPTLFAELQRIAAIAQNFEVKFKKLPSSNASSSA